MKHHHDLNRRQRRIREAVAKNIQGTGKLAHFALRTKHHLSVKVGGVLSLIGKSIQINRRQEHFDGSVLNALVPGHLSVSALVSHLPSTIYRRCFTKLPSLLALIVITSISLTAAWFNPAPTSAAINEQMNFQARLLSDTGGLVPDGNYHVRFKLYEDGDGQLGGGDENLAWTETRTTGNLVRVVNGYMSVQLGEVTPFGSSVDWNNDTIWLSIEIGGNGGSANWDGEMDPFMRLTSTPYAFNANQLDGRDSTEFVQLDPGATPQAVSTANSAIAVNQQGSGNLLTLQDGGTTELLFNQNAELVLGSSSDNGVLVLNDGTSNTGSIQLGNFDGNYTLTIPNPGQNDTFCLETLANCTSGSSSVESLNTLVGVLTIQGTANQISVNDDGSNTITVSLPHSVALGNASNTGSLVLQDGTGDTTTIQPGNSGGNLVFTLPTTVGSSGQCLKSSDGTGTLIFANCNNGSGSGGSVTLQDAYVAGNVINTTNSRDIVFNLADTATDANFIVNIQGTGNQLAVRDSGTDVFTISDGGHTVLQTTIDSTTAFQVLDADGGTPIFNVDTENERVGIGTASPSYKLDVVGNAGFDGGVYIDGASGDTQLTGHEILLNRNSSNYITASDANGLIVIRTGGNNNRLIVDATGNVNIGTDTVPNALFTVGATSQFQVNSAGAIQAATGITSSGTISFTGLGSGSGSAVCLNGSNQLVTCTTGSGGISGSGANGQIAYFNGTQTLTSGSSFLFDGTTFTNNVNTVLGDSSADTLTVNATPTFEVGLRISDGSSNYATIDVDALANDYTISIPTVTANDEFCLANLNNCASTSDTPYVLVAADNSSATAKAMADYVADGTSDEDEINSALTAAAGGKVVLAEGTFVADGTILIPNNTTLEGYGPGTVIELADIDTTDNLIEATGTNRTGQTVRNLKLDGRDDLNTAGLQKGIYFNAVGSGTGASARLGAVIENIWVNNFSNFGIDLANSPNSRVVNNYLQANDTGVHFGASHHTLFNGNTLIGNTAEGLDIYDGGGGWYTITNNIAEGNGIGFSIGESAYLTVANNFIRNSSTYGMILNTAGHSSVTGNSIYDSGTIGVSINATSDSVIYANKIRNSGGSTDNNGIHINGGDRNTIASNNITDTSCSTTCYAINISSASAEDNYLADNNIGTGTINDAGTGTIYGGQVDDTGDYIIQPAADIELIANTNITGSLTVSGTSAFTGLATFDGNLRISDGSSNYATIDVDALAGDYTVSIPTITANDEFCLANAANCAGGATTTLQQAYNNSGTPATIVTTSSTKNIILQSGTGFDSTTMFQVLDADGGNPVLSVDTVNERVGIGTAAPGAKLDIVHSDVNETALQLTALSGQAADLFVAGNSNYNRVTYLNEHGELRVIAGNNNTVAVRIKQRSALQTADLVHIADLSNNPFAVFNATGYLGLGDITPVAPLTVGDGDLFQVNYAGAIQAATGITSSGTITFSGLDCTSNANGGALTANSSGVISCSDDDGGSGSAITGSGANGQIAYFNGTQTLTSASNFLFNGTDFNVDNNTLFVDGAANRVGIGTNTPDVLFDIEGTTTTGTPLMRLANTSDEGELLWAYTNGVNTFRLNSAVGDAYLDMIDNSGTGLVTLTASNTDQRLYFESGNGNNARIGLFETSTNGFNILHNATQNALEVVSIVSGNAHTDFSVQRADGAALFQNRTDSTSAFRIQSATTSDTLITADTTNNRIKIGNSTGTGGTNTTLLVLDSATSDPTGVAGAIYYDSSNNRFRCYTTSWRNCADGSTSVSMRLVPEFAGGVLRADGSNNAGSMSSDFINGLSSGQGEKHNYYQWTTAQATAQDYDIVVNIPIPSDFNSIGAANTFKFWLFDGDGSSTNAQITWQILDDDETSCFSTAFNASSASTWEQISASTLGSCSFSANHTMTMIFKIQTTSGAGIIRLGEIDWGYNN